MRAPFELPTKKELRAEEKRVIIIVLKKTPACCPKNPHSRSKKTPIHQPLNTKKRSSRQLRRLDDTEIAGNRARHAEAKAAGANTAAVASTKAQLGFGMRLLGIHRLESSRLSSLQVGALWLLDVLLLLPDGYRRVLGGAGLRGSHDVNGGVIPR